MSHVWPTERAAILVEAYHFTSQIKLLALFECYIMLNMTATLTQKQATETIAEPPPRNASVFESTGGGGHVT